MMKKCRKILLSIFGILASFFWLAIPQKVSAVGEFSTSVSAEYLIDANGLAHVEKTFRLKNNFSTIYVTQYALEVSSNRLKNIKVTDSSGEIPANVVQTDNVTSIAINFPDKIVGKDQVREFTVSYDDPDTALLTGKILEVRIPRLADPEKFENYRVGITVPAGFREPAIASPPGYQVTTVGQQTKIIYSGSKLAEGVSLIFGEAQQYDFSLKYHLLNPSGSRGLTQIALPPDTHYQQVIFNDISPRPEKIEKDKDGNWIATYLLESKEEQTVTATGTVTVYLKPTLKVPQQEPSVELTQEDEFWQTSNPQIQELAQQYKTPQEIYDFVIETLDYNYQRLEPDSEAIRLGAVDSLAQPANAVCQEFADLFITLARANGIPARLAVGYAFTENPRIRPLSLVQDVLHAWPEYYDKEKGIWIPVDPTWGDTTGGVDYFSQFDFNHVVFAIQGHSSEKPYPAGSYKKLDVESRDVEITPVNKQQTIKPQFGVLLNPVHPRLPWRSNVQLSVTNQTGQAWYEVPVSIKIDNNVRSSEIPNSITEILPFETKKLSLLLASNDWVRPQQSHLSVTVMESSVEESITVAPMVFQFLGKFGYSSILQIIIFVLATLCIVLFFVIIAKFFHNRRNHDDEEEL